MHYQFSFETNLEIYFTTFTNIVTGNNGGAIEIKNPDAYLQMRFSLFENIFSSGFGGAVYFNGNKATFYSVCFDNCSCIKGGMSIYFDGYDDFSNFQFDYSTITRCSRETTSSRSFSILADKGEQQIFNINSTNNYAFSGVSLGSKNAQTLKMEFCEFTQNSGNSLFYVSGDSNQKTDFNHCNVLNCDAKEALFELNQCFIRVEHFSVFGTKTGFFGKGGTLEFSNVYTDLPKDINVLNCQFSCDDSCKFNTDFKQQQIKYVDTALCHQVQTMLVYGASSMKNNYIFLLVCGAIAFLYFIYVTFFQRTEYVHHRYHRRHRQYHYRNLADQDFYD